MAGDEAVIVVGLGETDPLASTAPHAQGPEGRIRGKDIAADAARRRHLVRSMARRSMMARRRAPEAPGMGPLGAMGAATMLSALAVFFTIILRRALGSKGAGGRGHNTEGTLKRLKKDLFGSLPKEAKAGGNALARLQSDPRVMRAIFQENIGDQEFIGPRAWWEGFDAYEELRPFNVKKVDYPKFSLGAAQSLYDHFYEDELEQLTGLGRLKSYESMTTPNMVEMLVDAFMRVWEKSPQKAQVDSIQPHLILNRVMQHIMDRVVREGNDFLGKSQELTAWVLKKTGMMPDTHQQEKMMQLYENMREYTPKPITDYLERKFPSKIRR